VSKASSQELALEEDAPVFSSSGPRESDWGQPDASQYAFEVDGDRLYGILVSGVYLPRSVAVASRGGVYLSATASAWFAVDVEERPCSEDVPILDSVIEPEANTLEWLALAEGSFDFWDNERDALYDDL